MKHTEDSPKQIKIYEGVLKLAETGRDLSLIKVQDIAEAAGIGKGTLYEYFRSKEEILTHTIFYCIRCELEQLRKIMDQASNFDELMEQNMEYVIQLAGERGASYRLVAIALKHDNELSLRFDELLSPIRCQLHDLMRQGFEMGLRDGSISPTCEFGYYSYICTSLFAGLANTSIYRDPFPLDDVRKYTRRLARAAFLQPKT